MIPLYSFLFLLFSLCPFLSLVSSQSLWQSRRLDNRIFDANLLSDSTVVQAWNAMPNSALSNGQYCDAEIAEWNGLSNSGNGAFAISKVCPNGVDNNIFYHMAAVFYISRPGLYSWRWAADVYYGGIMFIDNVKIQSRWRSDMPRGSDGMWWNYNWNDPTQYLVGYNISMSVGFHTMEIYGAEDCCDGGQGFEFDDGTGFKILSTRFLALLPPTSPTVYSWFPTNGSTIGGTNVTVIGKNLMLAGVPPFIQLQSTSLGVAPWVANRVYCQNSFSCSFILPAGSGSPLLQLTALGTLVLPLPRWPTDVFFTTNPAANQKEIQCVKLWNAALTARGWASTEAASRDYLCSVDSTSAIGFQFYFGAPPPSPYTMTCMSFASLGSAWTNARLCYPSVLTYSFQLFTDGSLPVNLACMVLRKNSDPQWQGRVTLCSQPNQPYGGDVFPRYSYSAPIIQSIGSTLSGRTIGGNAIVLTIASLGFNANTNWTRPTIRIGTNPQPCAITNITLSPPNVVTCTVPAGEGVSLPIRVTADGLTSAVDSRWLYSYNAPVINSVYSAQPLYAGGGVPLTVDGLNFGTTSVTVTISDGTNNYNCPVQSQSDGRIVCTLPAGQGSGLTISVRTSPAVGNRLSNLFPFSYLAPQVTGMTPNSGATSSVIVVTITGSSFGNSPLSNKVEFVFPTSYPWLIPGTPVPSRLSCAISTWSDGQIVCSLNRGFGASLNAIVTVGNQSSSANAASLFSFNAPQISSISPVQALSQNNVFLTILGSNFGPYTAVPQNYILVGAVPCTVQNFAQYSDSSIICSLPNQAGDPLAVTVSVWNQRSNALNFSYSPVFNPPPGPFLTSGNYVMRLTGCQNFGRGQREIIFDGSTVIPFIGCYLGDTECDFMFPAGLGFSHTLTVRTRGVLPPLSQRYTFNFDYGNPVLQSFSPPSGPGAGNFILTLRGLNFGNPVTAQLPAQTLTITIGGVSCPLFGTYNDTYATCTVPAGAGSANLIRLQVGSQQNTESLNFVYFGPTILSINSTNNRFPITGNIPIVIYGIEFRGSVSVNFGSTFLPSIPPVNVTTTSIQLLLPPGSGSVTVLVTANGQQSNGFIFNYDSPILQSYTTSQGPNPLTSGSATLTLNGVNFGPAKRFDLSDLVVRIFPLGRICALTGFTSDTQVTCTVPATEGGNGLIQIAGNAGSSNLLPITFAPPSLTLVNPTSGPTSGGVIVLTGTSFGTSAAGGTVTVGGFPCDYSSGTWTHTTISCTLPPLEGQTLPIIISRSGQNNSVQFPLFSYSVLPPVVTSLVASPSGQTQGGTVLTINGNNFGFNASISFNGSFTACRYPGGAFVPSSFVAYCILPPGQGQNLPVFVRVGPFDSPLNSQSYFSYDPPVLPADALSRNGPLNMNGPSLGGSRIILNGRNFGALGTNVITFNGVQLPLSAILSVAANRSQLVFQTPLGIGAGVPVSINVAGQSTSLPAPFQNSFSYDSPVISSVTGCPINAGSSTSRCPILATAADRLTINGQNFGQWPTQVKVDLVAPDSSLIPCSLVNVVDNQLIVQLPYRPAGGYNLPIRVETRTSDNLQLFPTISSNVFVSYTGPSFKSGSISLISLSGAPEARRRLLQAGANVALNSTAGGAQIELQGNSLGNNVSAITIRYGLNASAYGAVDGSAAAFNSKPYVCVPFYVATDGSDNSVVRCTLSAGVGGRLVFQALVGLQYSVDSLDTLAYPAPIIIPNSLRLDTADNPGRSVVLGQSNQGDSVFFAAQHIGPLPPAQTIANQITVQFSNGVDTLDCTSVALINYNGQPTVSCYTGFGLGSNYRFKLFAMGRPEFSSARGTDLYNYISPIEIYSVSGCSDVGAATFDCPTAGGTIITITTSVLAQGAILVRIGSSLCLNPSNTSATVVTCTLPPGAGSNVSVSVTAGVTYSLPTYLLSYSPPRVSAVAGCSSVLPAPSFADSGVYDCQRSGGQTLTLMGSDFGPANATVVVAGRVCGSLVHVSSTELRCRIPSGTEFNQPIIVIQNGGQAAAAPFVISYQQCLPGSFADPFNTINCIPCLAGTYSDAASATSCKKCDIGRFAPSAGMFECLNCNAGQVSVPPAVNVSIYGFSIGSTTCINCARGQYNAVPGSPTCLPCPSGGFSNSTGATVCYDCVAGFYSPQGSTACLSCTAGRYSSVPSAKQCDICPPGTTSLNTSTSCFSCSPGSFATNTDPFDLGCKPCALGLFSATTGQSACTQCAAGSFGNVTGLTACFNCQPGRSSIAGQPRCTDCPRGEFSPLGGPFCQRCPQGTFNPNLGSTGCSGCPRGEYSDRTGSQTCTKCSSGTYTAVNGSLICNDCLAGFFQPSQGSSACLPCSRGAFQPYQGQSFCFDCLIGQYNPSLNQLTCIDCPAGKFSNTTQASGCFSCSAGFYSVLQSNPPANQRCGPGGQPCINEAIAGVRTCQTCIPGRFAASSGASACTLCDVGNFNTEFASTVCSKCPAGSVASNPGADTCQQCDPGRFAPQPGARFCQLCDVGRAASNWSSTACSDCSLGFFSQVQGLSTCSNCSAGTFAPATKASVCRACQPGSYATSPGSSSCLLCPRGKYSSAPSSTSCRDADRGSFVSTVGAIGQRQCDVGTIAPTTGLSSCSQCPPGQFAANPGQSMCSNCSVGYFTNSFGSSVCPPCPAGYVGVASGLTSCDPCAAGTFASDSGLSVCTACSPGFAQSATGQSRCYRCHFGQAASSAGRKSCENCLVGSFSLQTATVNIGVINCDLCPPTTYQDAQGQNDCKSCPVGRAGNSSGLAICPACPSGFFADRTGSRICSPCPIGYFTSNPGAASCDPCPAGRYGNSSAASACFLCSEGYFQPYVAQQNCSACPAGKFSSAPGNAECQDCKAGEYSPMIAATVCEWCDVGYYQSSASQTGCVACPIGYFASSNHSTICTICSRGSFASSIASSACASCAPGSFALNQGSSNCSLCDFGTSAPGTGSSICLRCSEQAGASVASSRLYADQRGMANCKVCDLHSSADASEVRCLCDVGYAFKYPSYRGFRIGVNGTCTQCPRGAVCNTLGTIWDEMQTEEGWWEPGNKVYKKCVLLTNCPGGATESQPLTDLFPAQSLPQIQARLDFYNTSAMASPCGANRYGPLCALCRPGWIEGFGGVCFPCATSGASWFVLAVIIIAVILVLTLSYYLLLYADRAALNQAAEEERIKIREMAGYVEDFDVNTEMKKSRYDEWISTKGAARPKANYLFKVKIFISFAQIITNIAIGLPISWPERFKTVIAFLVPINFDFIQVSSIGCVVDTNYYRKIIGVIVYPIGLVLALLLFYWMPQLRKYTETKNWEHSIARKMVRKNTWKLIFFTLFFVYPNVSSTLLRIFVCEEVSGFYYLQADFRVNCYTKDWDSYAAVSLLFIIFYAVGTPILFFTALYRARRRLHEIGIRAEIGFLYDAFEREVWWFEVLDMAHKLLLTSLIVFLPANAQMPVAMVGSFIYTFAILVVRPYIRQSDDRLHLLCQTEILLLLLCGHVFYYEGNDSLMDYVLTVILLALVFGTITFFILQSWVAIWKRLKFILSKRARQREVAAGKAVRTWADLEEFQAEKQADSEARKREALEDDEELHKRDTYADVLPVLNRRNLAPQSRNLIGLSSGARVEMKRNVAFGIEGNNAIYDPVTDDVIEEAMANPLHKTAEGDEEDGFQFNQSVMDWANSVGPKPRSATHLRMNSGHIHPNPLIAAKLVYAKKFDYLNEREKNERKRIKNMNNISVSMSQQTDAGGPEILGTIEPDWSVGTIRANGLAEAQKASQIEMQSQAAPTAADAGPRAAPIELPEIEMPLSIDEIPLDEHGRLSSDHRTDHFESPQPRHRAFESIGAMPMPKKK